MEDLDRLLEAGLEENNAEFQQILSELNDLDRSESSSPEDHIVNRILERYRLQVEAIQNKEIAQKERDGSTVEQLRGIRFRSRRKYPNFEKDYVRSVMERIKNNWNRIEATLLVRGAKNKGKVLLDDIIKDELTKEEQKEFRRWGEDEGRRFIDEEITVSSV